MPQSRDNFKIKLLAQQLKFYNSDPIFYNYFSEVVEQLRLGDQTTNYMRNAYNVMKLNLKNQIILNSAIGYSENK